MITTVKKLWEQYPNATFVFWLEEYPTAHVKFESAKQLEKPMYNVPFEIEEGLMMEAFESRLKSNKIWIDREWIE